MKMRRAFQLPEEDEEALAARGLRWEAIIEGNTRWLMILGYPIPDGYNCTVADTALRMPPSYPDDQIDMVYFSPALTLRSGRGIAALSTVTIDGRQFQQWSRHRTKQNPWRIGLDNVGTHLLQVDTWLERELRKAAA